MMTLAEYRERVVSLGEPVDAVEVPLEDALGLVLAEPVTARLSVPPFSNSAMDGFAVRAADVAGASEASPVTLPVSADIPAGTTDLANLEPGTAARIMTGAPVPPGADAVLQVELTTDMPGNMAPEPPTEVTFLSALDAGSNIREAGSDIRDGDPAFDAGVRLAAGHISALASVGYGAVSVHRRPRVGVLSTGSELRRPGESVALGQIPDSNSLLLSGLIIEAGGEPVVLHSTTDDVAEFAQIVAESSADLDMLVTTGGVSVGAFDVVKAHLSTHGIDFTQVAMQPGKPQGSGLLAVPGRERSLPTVCLPGNPVSVFVSAHLFAIPLLRVLGGEPAPPLTLEREEAGTTWHKSPHRVQLMPCIRERANTGEPRGRILPASQSGSKSHHVYSIPAARGFAVTPAEVTQVSEGDPIDVWWLP